MTQSNKKADHDDHIDRISDLPSKVIDGILEHLNIIDVVRTSILSRKWRHMWVSVPRIEFDDYFFEKYDNLDDIEVYSIITEVLLLHRGPVHKFTLHIRDRAIRVECLNKWILFLSRSGIKDLDLVNQGIDPYQLSSYVFSCQELTDLKLHSVHLSVPPNFRGFKSLLDLQLYYIIFESGALENLISGCPLLEKLTISSCSGFECIDLSAPTLKVLHVSGDRVIKSICLKKAKNLVDFTLMTYRHKDEGGRTSDLIKGLPKIRRLVMGTSYTKILCAGTIPLTLLRSFSSLEYLKLNVIDLNEREFLFIVSILGSAPNMVELVIESNGLGARVPDNSEELECDNCCLSQLQTVNIKVETNFKRAMSLIRLILTKSSSLKTLTFDVGFGLSLTDAAMMLSISRDLLWMERASHRAKVMFLYRDLFNQ